MDYFDLTKQFNGNLSDAFKGLKLNFLLFHSLLIGFIQQQKIETLL